MYQLKIPLVRFPWPFWYIYFGLTVILTGFNPPHFRCHRLALLAQGVYIYISIYIYIYIYWLSHCWLWSICSNRFERYGVVVWAWTIQSTFHTKMYTISSQPFSGIVGLSWGETWLTSSKSNVIQPRAPRYAVFTFVSSVLFQPVPELQAFQSMIIITSSDCLIFLLLVTGVIQTVLSFSSQWWTLVLVDSAWLHHRFNAF